MIKFKAGRMVCLAVAFMFIFAALFTGCGASKNASTQAPSSVQPAAQLTEEKKPEYTEVIWYVPQPTANNQDRESVMAEVNKTFMEKLNCKLNMVLCNNDNNAYSQKIKVMSASGEAFDIFSAGGYLNMPVTNLVATGAVAPVDDLLNNYGKSILNKVDAKYWSAVTVDGKKYAMINPMVWAYSRGFVFKKDLVDKYQFDYKSVHNLKDLEPFLKTLKEKEPDIIPLAAAPGSDNLPGLGYETDTESIIPKYAIYFDYNSGTFKYWWENQEQKDKYTVLADYFKKGYISKNASTVKDLVTEEKSQKYAVCRDAGQYDETGAKSTNFFGFPTYESFYSTTPISTSSVTICLNCISSTSKNSERAMMLLDLLNMDKKLFNTLCFGLENQNYTVESGAGTDNPTVKRTADSKWLMLQPWIGDLYESWPSDLNGEDALNAMKKSTESASLSPIFGFAFDNEPVKKEIAQINTMMADIDILSTGAVSDVNKFYDDIQTKLTKAGIENVMKEVQKQYNDWKVKNGK